ncbi:MAG: amidohydrolase family protein, partial [Bacteroidaceae bacterium]|nr:amidohydrolase family protein [Bacteroidaceae bacterium]
MTTFRGKIFGSEGEFFFGEVICENGIIKEVNFLLESELTEEERSTLWIPGLVDIHSHGCMGHDTCEASKEELLEMLEFQRSIGVTSYCFTTMTYPEDKLLEIMEKIADIKDDTLAGIYLEGPFISKSKKGAQNEAYIQAPDAGMLKRLCAASKDLVKVVAIAPEADGALELIENLSGQVRFSVAHTVADYDKTVAAFEKGAAQVTHLYNAMSGLNHRDPGVVGAVFDSDTAMAELICDGI